ncbi:hypothetical protein WICPIJ_001691 [Wickerhamomyces pijperi]|uniref:PDZ GRASP-type domain-containing protein n=1 Tax=Wickerhamomyces pijperi TaxID=599730 RepID=A0A9P8QAD8_WICPI|nr:hypothetical protein WICPIJ_001691 [Wickerhamomyces pijperi]
MFSFAKKVVKSLEQSADTIFAGGVNEESQFDNDSYFAQARGRKEGFRVTSVKPDSIGQEEGFQSWFDYIIGVNGHDIPTNYTEDYRLLPNYEYFLKMIENCKGKSVTFEIWCAKGGVIKSIEVPISDGTLEDVPINNNPHVVVNQAFNKLGLTLQWTPLISSAFVYHVLEINANSPAEKAGLLPHSDYIIGAQDGLLCTGGEDLLGRVINSKYNMELILYVYNQEYDVVRPVTIVPSDQWGGKGYLGCGVGYGLLHRLPIPSSSEPGSVLFDSQSYNTPNLSQDNFQNFTPSNIPPPPIGSNLTAPPITSQNLTPTPPQIGQPPSQTGTHNGLIAPTPVHASRKKKLGSVAPTSDLLNYLSEEGEKSRKIDHEGATNYELKTDLPPPPK